MKRSPHTPAAVFALIQALALIGLMSCAAFAQDQSQYDHGTPPQLTAGVSAIGSYTSSDLGTVNLSSGSLNFKLPLGSVGGRGFSLPITLNYSNKVWSASKTTDFDPDRPAPGNSYPVVYASYDDQAAALDIFQRVAPGWSIGGVPVLRVRGIGINSVHNPNGCDEFSYALTKLTLILPDKGEIELRDDATDGAPLGTGYYGGCRWMDGNRGQRWHATDGSGTIFISDATNGVVNGNLNGTVITGDGMRYRILDTVSSGASVFLQEFGRTTSITDRNGNQLNIDYATDGSWVQYTDQLRRHTRIDFNAVDPDTGQTVAVLVTLPGYSGASRYYKIKTGTMNQHYRSGINPTLPVLNGDYDPLGKGYAYSGSHTSLFANSYGMWGCQERIDTQAVLTELVLPDARSMTFNYNEYGEVAEVVLPTGGKMQYDYAYTATLPSGNSAAFEVHPTPVFIPSDVHEIDRAVVARRTYEDGSTLESSWTYAYSATIGTDGNGWATAANGYTDVQARAADNSLLLNQRHYFMGSTRFLTANGGTGYSLWSTGIECRTETRNASNAVMAASEEDWTQRAVVSWSSYTTQQIANDNRVNESRKILDDGKVAKVKTFYLSGVAYNNPVEVQEFDFDQTNWTRRTTTTYADSSNLINGTNYTADSIRLLHLPLTVTVYDSSSNQKAQSVSEYDNYSVDGNHAALQSCASVIQHDSNFGTSYTTRGNVTRAGSWLNLTSSFIYSYPQYDEVGNVVAAKDANGNLTTISFADDFGNGVSPGSGSGGDNGATYALPTLITSPPPQSGQAQQTARSQYDFSTGLLTGFKDRNNVITQTFYFDPFNRPTQVRAALGITGVESHTAMYYAPQSNPYGITLTKNDVLKVQDQAALDDAMLRSWTKTDGFGRVIEAWTRDPLGDDKVVSNYDALGRTKQVSNPYRSGESPIYSTSAYDLAGRVTSVTTPDSAVVSTSYSGNTVTVTDQNSKARKSVTDGLGRLVQVYEDPAGLNYLTSYSYDVLDNLTTVNQGSQTRSFVYDSLKRLTSATNPESGTVSYQYDNNGNLSQKTDARSIVTTYAYDALNRNTTVNYSNTTSNPDIARYYDNTINYGKGRFYYDLYYKDDGTIDHQAVDGYDPFGRVWVKRQVFYSGSQWYHYESRQTYDLAGHPKTLQYPSGHTVTYNYDSAGRLADNGSNLAFSGNLGDGTSRTYSQGVIYNPLGGMTKEQFGTTTPVYNKLFYNSRGQLAEIRESTSYTGAGDTTWDRGAIINSYSVSCSGMCGGHNSTTAMTDNNGNLKTQQVMIPGSDSFLQIYSYDSLNRLQAVSEAKNGGATNWQQQYVYDRYGNRTIDQTNTWGTGIPKPNFGVDITTNRLTPPAGAMQYDAAGNLTNDTFTGEGSRVYDAENKMTQAWANSQWQYYAYDADGHRVRRKVNGIETWQVYGPNGELLVEYAAAAAATSPQKEYGYRNGQLLVTAEPGTGGGGGGGTQNVTWTNAVGVSVNGNSLTKTAADGWGNAGASSTQTITSGDGYVEFTATENTTPRLCGLTHTDSDQHYSTVDFALAPYSSGALYIFESGSFFQIGYYSPGDVFRVAIESGVVKYRQNGNLLYTSTGSPSYPLRADTSFYSTGATITNAIISSGSSGGSSAQVHWLVTDQLGTPRLIFDQSGSVANMSRHDYLPFGEELGAGTGGRTTAQGYSASDGVRQHFTQKERDNETGLDFFEARYYASMQGRFASPDPIFFQKEMVNDPQRFNLYSYVRNNPLKLVDPNGLAIELTGNDEERKKKLELLKQVVGKDAGAYLYENKGKDGKYYVGIYTNGPDGKSKPFEQVNSVAGDIGKVIRDSFVASIEFVRPGTVVNVEGGQYTIDKVDVVNNTGPAASYTAPDGRATIYLLDPKYDPGQLPGVLFDDHKAEQVVLSDVLAHEIGHPEAHWGYVYGPSNTNAVDLENRARRLRDPNAHLRTGHNMDTPRDAVGPQPFIINVRPGTQGGWKP